MFVYPIFVMHVCISMHNLYTHICGCMFVCTVVRVRGQKAYPSHHGFTPVFFPTLCACRPMKRFKIGFWIETRWETSQTHPPLPPTIPIISRCDILASKFGRPHHQPAILISLNPIPPFPSFPPYPLSPFFLPLLPPHSIISPFSSLAAPPLGFAPTPGCFPPPLP